MIRVSFHQTGNKLSLLLKGHAGYADIGQDIICASASILAYTVAQFVMEAEYDGDLVSPAQIQLESGDTFVLCEPTEDNLQRMHDIYSYAKMGYHLLAHRYPQFVEINDVEAE